MMERFFFFLTVLTEGVKRVGTEVMVREGGGIVVATEERGESVVEGTEVEGMVAAKEAEGDSSTTTKVKQVGVLYLDIKSVE